MVFYSLFLFLSFFRFASFVRQCLPSGSLRSLINAVSLGDDSNQRRVSVRVHIMTCHGKFTVHYTYGKSLSIATQKTVCSFTIFSHGDDHHNVPFLEVMVSLNNGTIETDLYTKPTDKHQHLLSSSCHPQHTKRAIPFSLALRIRRICSTDTNFTLRLNELRAYLLA